MNKKQVAEKLNLPESSIDILVQRGQLLRGKDGNFSTNAVNAACRRNSFLTETAKLRQTEKRMTPEEKKKQLQDLAKVTAEKKSSIAAKEQEIEKLKRQREIELLEKQLADYDATISKYQQPQPIEN